jgi:hypothetical protein
MSASRLVYYDSHLGTLKLDARILSARRIARCIGWNTYELASGRTVAARDVTTQGKSRLCDQPRAFVLAVARFLTRPEDTPFAV